PWPEAIGRFVGIWFANLGIGFQKAIAAVFWFLEKLAAAFSGLLMDESLWETLRGTLLDTLISVMPGALGNLVLGSTGLLYVALMLAGVLMTMPLLGESRPVQAWRVIVWGAVLITLFISGTAGYDLIGFFEELRIWAMQTVVEAVAPDTGLDALVARPMQATGEETSDLTFALPERFAETYFPEPSDEDYEIVEMVVGSGLLGFSATLRMETEESLESRKSLAGSGVGVAALTLVPAYVVLLFGIVFAALSAAALLLVVFFIAAAPMGFFEFGATILSGIAQQYVYLFALSLMVSVLAGLLAGVGAQAFPEGERLDVAGMVTYLPVLVIVGMMMQQGVKMAWSALTGTLGLAQRAMSSVGTMAYVGAPARQGQASPLSTVAKLAAGVGLAAATGGASAALMAGAGSLLSGTKVGGAAARVATAAGGGKGAHVFAAAVRARGVSDTAAGVVATNVRFRRMEERHAAAARARGERAFRAEVQRESKRLDPRWKAVDAGAFLTADLGALESAERAFFQERNPRLARRNLEQVFGSREVADEVAGVYDRDGKKGAMWVRRVVETTQATALRMAAAGRPVFNERGEATDGFRRAVRSKLVQARLLDERDEWEATSAGKLAGAVVRRPVGIWTDPEAPRKLARDTLEPEATEVAAGDVAAQYRLRDLALRLRWDEGQLEALFEAVRDGQAAALQSGRSVEDAVFDIISQASETFNPAGLSSRADMREVARLSVMVADGAQVQRRANVDLESRAATPPSAPVAESVSAVEPAAAATPPSAPVAEPASAVEPAAAATPPSTPVAEPVSAVEPTAAATPPSAPVAEPVSVVGPAAAATPPSAPVAEPASVVEPTAAATPPSAPVTEPVSAVVEPAPVVSPPPPPDTEPASAVEPAAAATPPSTPVAEPVSAVEPTAA
ncbi:MAG: hypothetical protein DRH24_19535, partial [Deltaproteobacteria bacterium]